MTMGTSTSLPRCPHLENGDDTLSSNSMAFLLGVSEIRFATDSGPKEELSSNDSKPPKKQNGEDSRAYCIHKQLRREKRRTTKSRHAL